MAKGNLSIDIALFDIAKAVDLGHKSIALMSVTMLVRRQACRHRRSARNIFRAPFVHFLAFGADADFLIVAQEDQFDALFESVTAICARESRTRFEKRSRPTSWESLWLADNPCVRLALAIAPEAQIRRLRPPMVGPHPAVSSGRPIAASVVLKPLTRRLTTDDVLRRVCSSFSAPALLLGAGEIAPHSREHREP